MAAFLKQFGRKGRSERTKKQKQAQQKLAHSQLLENWSIPSEPGNERAAISYVVEAVKQFNLPARRMEQLKTAVAEATMNAMEHGNHYDPQIPVTLQILAK